MLTDEQRTLVVELLEKQRDFNNKMISLLRDNERPEVREDPSAVESVARWTEENRVIDQTIGAVRAPRSTTRRIDQTPVAVGMLGALAILGLAILLHLGPLMFVPALASVVLADHFWPKKWSIPWLVYPRDKTSSKG